MKKIISLVLLSSILLSNFSVLAGADSSVEKDSCVDQSDLQQGRKSEKVQELEKDSSCRSCDACKKNQNLCKAIRVARSVLTTAIILGTFATMKGLSMQINRKTRSIAGFLAYKTLLGVAGTCLSVASLVGIGENFKDLANAGYEGDTGMVNRFCFYLNLANIFALFYNFKSILTQKFVLQL